ncbi:DUF4767 domain-containing protein [Lacticaseibacillus jixiensis]|uniref:DUF4767 domain-containing protein n=1 Tax=Lacticaseibacillus jixiensis TaxID=3231926 RepID=UPI0036F3E921
MGKIWGIAVGAAIGLLGLSGCQQKSQAPATHKASSAAVSKSASGRQVKVPAAASSSVKPAKASSSSSVKQAAPWSSTKAAQLETFMQQWGQSMGQTYVEYDDAHPVDFYGLKVPTELGRMPPAIGEQKINYSLSQDGQTTADYAVVAIYSDAATAGFGGEHLYLFTLYHGQPKVLVTMQNQGNEKNWLYFSVTQNADLAKGFADIAAGKSAVAPAAKVGPQSSREAITRAEEANGNMPLAWEPIKNYKQAEALLKVKFGDGKWVTGHGSAGISSPIYWSVTLEGGTLYKVVYATGEIKDFE